MHKSIYQSKDVKAPFVHQTRVPCMCTYPRYTCVSGGVALSVYLRYCFGSFVCKVIECNLKNE